MRVRHRNSQKLNKNSAFYLKIQSRCRYRKTHPKVMDCTSDILKRIDSLERVIRAQNDILIDLAQRVGDKLSKEVFTMKELAVRWNCSEMHVRDIIKLNRIPLMLGVNRAPRKPFCVSRFAIMEIEKGRPPSVLGEILDNPPKASSKVLARGFVPNGSASPKAPIIFGKGVRRLGESKCESEQVKSRGRKSASCMDVKGLGKRPLRRNSPNLCS